jgi:multisubunit Na+/H+ antiporter MnhB subunit
VATLGVTAILVGAIWAAETLADTGVVQAVIWTSSFVFLALAVDSSPSRFQPLLVTGLVLGVLAMLATPAEIGFTILAAAIISAWVAWAILRNWKA